MKKLTAVMITAALLFAGCGDSEKVIDGNVENAVTGGTQTESPEEAGNGGQEQEPQAETEHKGYVFVVRDVTLEVDGDAAPVVEALGEPVSYFEAASCAFEGLDKIYTYNGFEIDTYPMQDKDMISSIILKDDSVMTAEGICIGDSLEKLQQAYGSGGTEEGGMLVYGKDGMKLCFILQGENIISIEYRSTVLDEG